jgi:site-specific recombinase XerD
MEGTLPMKHKLQQPYLEHLAQHLKTNCYSTSAKQKRMAEAGRFLSYLRARGISPEVATPTEEQNFLDYRLKKYRKRHNRPPRDLTAWRWGHTHGIHMLMRLVQGQWPPVPRPATRREAFHQELCGAYAQWLSAVRGLSSTTIPNRCMEAKRFLESLRDRGESGSLSGLTVADLDHYINSRAPQLRRVTRQRLVICLRGFLRYLHARSIIKHDLASAVVSSRRYAFEGIPPVLRADHIRAVLKSSKSDCSPKGWRDYAILLLLSTYGLRAGEITALQLDDIDWRKEQLHIRHSKTGGESFLPLLPSIGEAILRYLQRGRPVTSARAVFLRARAPFHPLCSGSSLYHMVEDRLRQTGIKLERKHGPHAFRHARAVSLLDRGLPLKSIGDVLGHRSTEATAVYLKLATSELRTVGLDIPSEVR